MSLINLFSKKDGKARRRGRSLSPIRGSRSEEILAGFGNERISFPTMSQNTVYMPMYTPRYGENLTVNLSEKEMKELNEKYKRAASQGFELPKESLNIMKERNIVSNGTLPRNKRETETQKSKSEESPKTNETWLTYANQGPNQLAYPSIPHNYASFPQQIPQPWSNMIPAQVNPNFPINSPINTNYALNTQQINPMLNMQGTNFQNTPYLSLHQAVRQIPTFDGSVDRLPLFCSVLRSIVNNFGPGCQIFIMYELATKLMGKAADIFTARLMQYESIEALIADLQAQYNNVTILEELSTQLKLITQQQGESATDFGARAQALLNRLLTIYDTIPALNVQDRLARKQLIERDALQYYLFGLISPLDMQVRCEKPQTLRKAIQLAADFENKQKTRLFAQMQNSFINGLQPVNSIAQNTQSLSLWSQPNINSMMQMTQNQHQLLNTNKVHEAQIKAMQATPVKIETGTSAVKCSYCDKEGHKEGACIKKKYDKIQCAYCDKMGHATAECQTLRNDAENGIIHAQNKNNAQNVNNNKRKQSNDNKNYTNGPRSNYSRSNSNDNNYNRNFDNNNYNRNFDNNYNRNNSNNNYNNVNANSNYRNNYSRFNSGFNRNRNYDSRNNEYNYNAQGPPRYNNYARNDNRNDIGFNRGRSRDNSRERYQYNRNENQTRGPDRERDSNAKINENNQSDKMNEPLNSQDVRRNPQAPGRN